MPTYTVAQAKNQLSKLLNETQEGAKVTITRHGKVIAQIVPAPPEPQPMTREELGAMFARARKRPLRGGGTWADIIRSTRDDEPE